mgnify:CR=1 FL=1
MLRLLTSVFYIIKRKQKMLNEVKRLCKNDFEDLGREKIINEEKRLFEF